MAAVRRTLRSWRLRYRPGRPMFWERPITFEGVRYAAGDLLPESLYGDKTWLRTRWVARLIDFVPDSPVEYRGANKAAARLAYAALHPVPSDPPPADTGAGDGSTVPPPPLELPAGVEVTVKGGGWQEVSFPDGTVQNVQGEPALRALLAEYLASLNAPVTDPEDSPADG